MSPIAIPRHSVNADPVTDTPHRVGQIVKIEPGVTKCEATKDVKPAIARQPEPEPTANGCAKLKSLLLAYSRAVIDSTNDHPRYQAQILEDAITSAKAKVIEHHEAIIKDLQSDITVGEMQNSLLLDTIIALEEEDVDKKIELEECRLKLDGYERLRKADADIIAEYEAMTTEISRKKQKRVEIWEKAENVKLGI